MMTLSTLLTTALIFTAGWHGAPTADPTGEVLLTGSELQPQDPKQDPKKQDPKNGDPQQDPKKGVPKKQDPKKDPKKGDPQKGGDPDKQDPKDKPKDGDKPKDEEKDEVIRNEDDYVIPETADPEDIRAIRAANRMLAAERRLARMLKDGEIEGLDRILTFDEIASWPYQEGLVGMPEKLKKLDGEKVMMIGFMLPIDEVENIKEFLLVQSLWACCYGQPPDINGIVRVIMPGKKRTDYFFDPLKIVGTFKVESTVLDGYCVDIFQLVVDSMEPLK